MSVTDPDPGSLLENLLSGTPGARHALLISAAGLELRRSESLTAERAGRLAAIVSGIQSLSHGASVEFGDGTGGVRQSMTEFSGGILCIVEAHAGARLAVIADADADVGAIGRGMHGLTERLGADPDRGRALPPRPS